ncbi:MAG: DUF2304 family protein [Thomasclavelia sp.]
MTLTLQLILIILSVFLFLILIRKCEERQITVLINALVWLLLCSIALIIVAIFPQIVFIDFIGVITTANMYLLIIFTNYCSLYIACQGINTRRKTKNLIQHIAILEKELQDKEV